MMRRGSGFTVALAMGSLAVAVGGCSSDTLTSESSSSSSSSSSSASSGGGMSGMGGMGGMGGAATMSSGGGMGGASSSTASGGGMGGMGGTSSSISGGGMGGMSGASSTIATTFPGGMGGMSGTSSSIATTSGGGMSGTSSSIATTSSGMGGAVSSSGSGGQCMTPQDCPGMDTACQKRTCMAGQCGVNNLPAGTVCSVGSGKLCDGNGACVECLVGPDCASGVCVQHQCAAPTCNDGVQNGMETGVDCGGPSCPICPTVLALLGGSANMAGMAGGEFHPGGAWTVTSLNGRTVDGVALTITSKGQGVGLMRFTQIGAPNDNHLRYATWTAGAPNGVWAQFQDLGPNITTRAAPTISAATKVAQAAFHGQDFKFYYASFDNNTWAPIAEPVGAVQSFGPVPPEIAARGNDATLAFINGGSGNDVFGQDRSSAVWGPGQDIGNNTNFNVSPALVALTAGPELLVAYARSDNQIMFATRTGGVWTAPAPIAGALTGDRASLAALPSGNAALAFRGTDTNLYVALYAGGVWSGVVAFANPNVSVQSPPSIVRGVGSAAVELGYVDNAGKAFHSRFINNAWTAPVQIGAATTNNHIALASGP